LDYIIFIGKLLKILCEHGADLTIGLRFATQSCNFEAIQMLVARGAQIDTHCLFQAFTHRHQQIINFFIENGADLTVVHDERTLAHVLLTRCWQHLRVAQWDIIPILDRIIELLNLDINVCNGREDLALLDMALLTEMDGVVDYLVSRGAKVYNKDILGTYPCSIRLASKVLERKICGIPSNHLFAIVNQYSDTGVCMGMLLLVHGADINYRENDRTILEYCEDIGEVTFLKALRLYLDNPHYAIEYVNDFLKGQDS